ncbi:MAG: chromosomal replication initiator protein DnaA [Tissierellia bacterium]|nr:chromosomal replication initiator protein DnaA [Tissierellia bacterium]
MDVDLSKIWIEIKEMFKLELSELTYNTWISRLEPIDYNGSEILIHAPNDFTKRMIEQRYKDNMKEYLNYLLNKEIDIIIVDPSSEIKSLKKQSIDDIEMKKDDIHPIKEEKVETIRNEIETVEKPNQLNQLTKKYTFDNFVAGKSNEFALSATMAVANSPGVHYNPLFIYGGAGLGKTHLMYACVDKIKEKYPDLKVVFLSSETFTNDLIQSLNSRKNIEFRKKYRGVDVLLVDDIQFIAGKTGTQEEFFHTFNDLYNANKQIIISSDRPPKEIKTLEDRLISRFEWGLLADIQQPDFETRVAILNKKVEMERLSVSDEVLEYIAMNIKDNIRELEGALLRVVAYSTLMKSDQIDLKTAQIALKKLISSEEKVITIDLIKDMVTDNYGLKSGDLESKNRSRRIAFPRQIAMYLSRQMTDLSLLKIANSFNRDHSTVIHGIDKVTEMIEKDTDLYNEVESIIEKIKS